ncbi:MAG: hypothetical protein IH595_08150 [Bacteroidales bacterium]|nr:hypothetical protein [Bacteroidales bacterium]
MSKKLEITSFIQEEKPLELFISYFRNVIENNCNLNIYNKDKLSNFFLELGYLDLWDDIKEKIIDLSLVFKSNALFDYRLKGDYSPKNISDIFLNKRFSTLDPSLLNMDWWTALMNRNSPESLKENTYEYIKDLTEFQYAFNKYLMDLKTINKH